MSPQTGGTRCAPLPTTLLRHWWGEYIHVEGNTNGSIINFRRKSKWNGKDYIFIGYKLTIHYWKRYCYWKAKSFIHLVNFSVVLFKVRYHTKWHFVGRAPLMWLLIDSIFSANRTSFKWICFWWCSLYKGREMFSDELCRFCSCSWSTNYLLKCIFFALLSSLLGS